VPATVTYNATTKTATLDPGASLAAGTTYTATLTGGATAIRDSANQPLTSGGWSFTTATATTDGTAPTVTARAPAVNATKVAVSANVTATFSEAVQGVDSTTFAVTDPNGAVVPAVVSRDGTTNRWILNPNANLATDTRYTVTLTGGSTAIRDLAGNALTSTSWQFLTGPAPTVSTRTPAAGATGVSKTANITATFSEAVQGVSTTTFTLKNTATGALVTATVTKNATTNQWILDPGVTLAANTKYTVTVTGGTTAVRDLAGNPLTTTTWAFTTGA
jgi:methionine-rich copper-binding protein CopC